MHSTRDSKAKSIERFEVYAKVEFAGWDISLCEFSFDDELSSRPKVRDEKGKHPFVMFEAVNWTGIQPRYIVTSGDKKFLTTIRDLQKIGVKKCSEVHTSLQIPIQTNIGFPKIIRGSEVDKIWKELTGVS